MKPTTQGQKSTELNSTKEETELNERIIGLVDTIIATFAVPHNWPWSDEDRIATLRELWFRARTINESKEYAALKVKRASVRLSDFYSAR